MFPHKVHEDFRLLNHVAQPRRDVVTKREFDYLLEHPIDGPPKDDGQIGGVRDGLWRIENTGTGGLHYVLRWEEVGAELIRSGIIIRTRWHCRAHSWANDWPGHDSWREATQCLR